jgi:hypothetical protein
MINTVDIHAIITMIATFHLTILRRHSHSIINSTYRAELSIQHKEETTVLLKSIKQQPKPYYVKLVPILDNEIE